MTDQSMPTRVEQDVTPIARRVFLSVLDAQEQKGRAKYGTTLQTFNGRDAIEDALQELADLVQYLVQWRMEREVLLARLADCERLIAALEHERSAVEHKIDAVNREIARLKGETP